MKTEKENLSETKKVVVQIKGIQCESCISRLNLGLSKIKQVKKYFIDSLSHQAFLDIDNSMTLPQLAKAFSDIGNEIEVDSLSFKISKKQFLSIKDNLIKQFSLIQVDYDGSKCKIKFIPTSIPKTHIISFLEKYSIKNIFETHSSKIEFKERFKIYFSFGLLALLIGTKISNLVVGKDSIFFPIIFIIATLSQFWIGFPFIKGALKDLFQRVTSMDTMIAIGSLSAYFYSTYLWIKGAGFTYFEASAFIVLFTSIGKWIEKKIKYKQLHSIKKLQSARNEIVQVYKNSQLYEIPKNQVRVGDILLIKTAEEIHFNGIIVKGNSFIDESSITGEPYPRKVSPDEKVYSATFNKNNPIFVKVLSVENQIENLFYQIKNLKEKEIRDDKSLSTKLNQVTSIFIPFILGLAFVSFIILFVLAQFEWIHTPNNITPLELALVRAITILVISCPCIIGITIPMTIGFLSTLASKLGIIVQNSNKFESLKSIDVIAFDKTGTLSEGKMQINAINIINKQFSEKEIFLLTSLLQSYSSHPIATIFLKKAKEFNINPNLDHLSKFKIIDGMGLEGYYKEKHLAMGNQSLLKKYQIKSPIIQQSHCVTIFLVYDRKIIASFELYDPLRLNTQSSVDYLKKYYELSILSGSNEKDIRYISEKTQISSFYYNMLPEDKKNWIKEQQKHNKQVLMIGDGLNDIQAFTQANISICLSSQKNNLLTHYADFIIPIQDKNALHKIILILKLGKMADFKIKTNLFWTFIYNSLALPLAILGLITPSLGSFIMALSSISITLNSTSLLFQKSFKEEKSS